MRLANLLIIFCLSFSAFAYDRESILMVDTDEFNYINHDQGKKLYLKRIAQILRDMNIQDRDFRSANLSDKDLQKMIADQQTWDFVIETVTKACEQKTLEKLCGALQEERYKTFDYILENPAP